MDKVIVLMGVCGCGKTTIGELLSKQTGLKFFDGDNFHPESNREKMRNSIPLNDEDRYPWLKILSELIQKQIDNKEYCILACSALKQKYRDILKGENKEVVFVHLFGDKELLLNRLKQRKGHYMPASLLDSQFETLETPVDAVDINIAMPPEEIIERIVCNC